MKNLLTVMLAGVLCSSVARGEETVFSKVKLADPTGKLADARLVFNDSDKKVVVRVAGHDR